MISLLSLIPANQESEKNQKQINPITNPVYFNYSENEIRISIIYSLVFKKYQAIFERNHISYTPQETNFKSTTFEGLLQNIEAEVRSDAFLIFFGINARKIVIKAITTAQPFFNNCP
jgi:hypothetical protein